MKLNGSEIIVECLKEQGVDTVFGYPGGAILNVYDALYKHSDEITHILTSHEQGAAHAADGYARATGIMAKEMGEGCYYPDLSRRMAQFDRKETDMRTEGDLIKINDWLLPLSWIYVVAKQSILSLLTMVLLLIIFR